MYTPTNPPSDPQEFQSWAYGELLALSRQLSGAMDWITLDVRSVAPAKPRAGMVCNADGVAWNPGGTGAGLYQYITGTGWVKL
jgi:hypothetical protein